MQIIIPMSGFGERFRQAGYKVPKPMIEIDNKPIISYVIDMFPGEKNFIFICNKDHLENSNFKMKKTLKKYCPSGKIISIDPHKLGPINAIYQVENALNPDEPTIVNYCDFTCYWEWSHFKKYINLTKCIGAIPAYKGFHPHSLGSTNYAYILESEGWLEDIQEKKPYTNNRMEEYASSGTYYFKTAKIMLQAFKYVIEKDLNVGGEYYVSLAYKFLLNKKHPVAIYPLQHFMQWGTPEDVSEYKYWSKAFNGLIKNSKDKYISNGALVLPMGGLGQRFSSEGYLLTKPLIPVSGLPMVLQAIDDLPLSKNNIFVLRKDMPNYKLLHEELLSKYPNSIIKYINKVTEGQACTAKIGLDIIKNKLDKNISPITIGACDNGALYDISPYYRLINDKSVDIIVWGIRGYPNAIRNPKMFGWIDEKKGKISSISVKTPLKHPQSDPIVLGTFTFKKAEYFQKALSKLKDRSGRVNGEYYIDSLINDAIEEGLNCQLFEIESYLCWGTPNDLKTFEYWQSCFHKWNKHPYNLALDKRVPKNKIASLKNYYNSLIPKLPIGIK